MDLIKIEELEFSKLIESREIKRRIELMANLMTNDLEGSNPLFLIVLKGAFIFAADLVRKFHFECDIEFADAKSYKGTQRGSISLDHEKLKFVKDRNVVLVEDIVDSGSTIEALIKYCKTYGAASVRIAAFLSKPSSFTKAVKVDYVGFEISPHFVVGYGLDYNGKGRNLKDIYQIIPYI